jgi:CHAT domain-containing protein
MGAKLYDLVWRKIEPYLPQHDRLFIAPDGALNLISFATLMDEKGKYLIEKHPIHYLSAGRDLIRISQDSTQSGEGLLALGDPDYNATASQRISNEKTFAVRSASTTEVGTTRNVRSNCGALSEMKASPLPNTKAEVDAIANFFPSSNVFDGRAASEENFKKNAAGRKAIHIATHGYFISGECQEKLAKKSESYVGENPLLQSGLLLAGANLHGSDIKNDEAEDGIVTALEVSAMDLRGTELVVLSACETGLGRVEQGEGVYGLRRAFQMAGAKTVVSSLWQVPDKETAKFMRELYARMSNTSKRGSARMATYPELMQKVALERITELRERGRPTHPYTWGGFIATGDWKIK